MRRLPTGRLFAGAAILLTVFGVGLWAVPSNDYLFEPNRARSLAPRVKVEGERSSGPGGIYYVDVTIRKASWLERLAPFLRPNGSTLVSRRVVLPRGTTFDERRQEARADMARSEQVAAAVALREAGYDVAATPKGALVEAVAPDVPAAETLKAGDVIVAVDGEPVGTPADLRRRVSGQTPGRMVTLRIRRDRAAKTITVTVTTVADPRSPKRAIIGIQVGQEADIKLPVEVDIDLGDVGGPSAGLAFALDILEELGRNVDRGCTVAATGELELDGAVAPVGGLKQKTYGARRADVDVLLVPAGDNADEARRYADGLRVVPVSSFQQALRELETFTGKC